MAMKLRNSICNGFAITPQAGAAVYDFHTSGADGNKTWFKTPAIALTGVAATDLAIMVGAINSGNCVLVNSQMQPRAVAIGAALILTNAVLTTETSNSIEVRSSAANALTGVGGAIADWTTTEGTNPYVAPAASQSDSDHLLWFGAGMTVGRFFP